MVKDKSPDVIILSETKCKRERIEIIKNKINFDHSFVVNCICRSGGLAFFWKKEVVAVLDFYSNHHISLSIFSSTMDKKWIVLGSYGQLVAAKRKESWDLLRLIHSHIQNPWLCMEDFNEIPFQDE